MEMSSGISRCVPVLTIILFFFFYHQQLFSILSLHSWKSLHVNILYIKGEFHLFSKFCNCQCERSTCVTHAASNTHLILITPLRRLRANSSQVFTWFFSMICLKLTIYARRRSWKYTGRHIVMFFPFKPLTSCVLLYMIYSCSPQNLSEVCSIYDLAHITSAPTKRFFGT